jgi:hypothetical protein
VFVIAGADTDAIDRDDRRASGSKRAEAIDLPMLRVYHPGLGFPLGAARPAKRDAAARWRLPPRSAIAASWRRSRTARRWSAALPGGRRATRSRSGRNHRPAHHLTSVGIVTRFGCVVRHDKLGFNSNAMAVWDA